MVLLVVISLEPSFNGEVLLVIHGIKFIALKTDDICGRLFIGGTGICITSNWITASIVERKVGLIDNITVHFLKG